MRRRSAATRRGLLTLRSASHSAGDARYSVADTDVWQVSDFLLAQRGVDTVACLDHRLDRNRYLSRSPEVTLLEEDMGDVVVFAVDHKTFHATDHPVSREHAIAALDLHFSERHTVVRDRCRPGHTGCVDTSERAV